MLAAALLAASVASAASAAVPACTRAHDRELEVSLPASLHARLASLPGPHAKRAASFMLRHPELALEIAVRPVEADRQPTLPLMSGRAMMQFMTGRGYKLAHNILHEEGLGEAALARKPAALAALTDSLLPVWVHELSHAARIERPVRWPLAATIENELVACYEQALFTAEVLETNPDFAGLRETYRLMRAAEKGGVREAAAYKRKAAGRRTTIEALEIAAASTEEFERLYRRAYGTDSSLRDPLMAGMRITNHRTELAHLLDSISAITPAQLQSARQLLDYGKDDDAFWLDSKATMAARDDAESELKELRRELEEKRPVLRAWFAAAGAGKPDWKRLINRDDLPVGVAPPDSGSR